MCCDSSRVCVSRGEAGEQYRAEVRGQRLEVSEEEKKNFELRVLSFEFRVCGETGAQLYGTLMGKMPMPRPEGNFELRILKFELVE